MADHGKQAAQPRTPAEFDRELDFRAVLVFMAVIAAITIGTFVAMWWMGVGLKSHLTVNDPPAFPITENADELLPPLPRLQVKKFEDWDAMKAADEAHLATYSWVDRSNGMVRIPIEEAMRRVAEQGLPEFPAPPSTEPVPTNGSVTN